MLQRQLFASLQGLLKRSHVKRFQLLLFFLDLSFLFPVLFKSFAHRFVGFSLDLLKIVFLFLALNPRKSLGLFFGDVDFVLGRLWSPAEDRTERLLLGWCWSFLNRPLLQRSNDFEFV